MSDDKVYAVSFLLGFLGFFAMCAYGCEVETQRQIETQKVRGSSPTVTTCIEHSILDRIEVVQ